MPGHLPATGSVWAISDTANKTVAIGRGLLEAATSDDINPVALITCESFGALLPISPETRVKVEKLARRNHTSHVFNFIKAQIGYRKDDSVEQLSRSDAGIRFLCLVATLCTLDHYEAAERLDAMLQAMQQGQQIRPTIKQLQVMVNSMKTKMILSDFATNIVGFEILLRASSIEGEDNRIDVAQVPSKDSLQQLIMAMNQLGRISEADAVDRLEVRTSSCFVPWTCAFVKWLLGAPPIVKTARGQVLLDQDEALVTVTITSPTSDSNRNERTRDGQAKVDVVSYQRIRGLRDIVFPTSVNGNTHAWQGLVSAQTWVDYQFSVMLSEFPQLQQEGLLRYALGQALYFIVAKLPERLVVCEDSRALEARVRNDKINLEHLFHPNTATPFLDREVRLHVATNLVGKHLPLILEDKDERRILLPQNLAKLLGSGCRQCVGLRNSIFGGQLPCQVHKLLNRISELGSTLLVLSLFGPRSETFPWLKAGLMFETSNFHHHLFPLKTKTSISSDVFSNLILTGWQALMHEECNFLSCPAISIFKFTAKLMGHQNIWNSTIVSSKYGQVLFPAFFDANDFLGDGVLQMCAFPGKLQKGDVQFDFLLDSWSDKLHTEGLSDAETETVDTESAAAQEEIDEDISHGSDIGDDDEVDQIQPQHEDHDSPNEEVADEPPDTLMVQPEAPVAQHPVVPRSHAGTGRSLNTSDYSLDWSISVRDDILHSELRLSDNGQPVIAWSLVDAVARAILTSKCAHSTNRQAGTIADSFELVDEVQLRGSDSPRALIVTGQSYKRQLEVLQTQDFYPPVIVHVEGCIRCALQLGLLGRIVVS